MKRETEKATIHRLARKYSDMNFKPQFRVVTIFEDFMEDEWPKIKDKVLAGENGWWSA